MRETNLFALLFLALLLLSVFPSTALAEGNGSGGDAGNQGDDSGTGQDGSGNGSGDAAPIVGAQDPRAAAGPVAAPVAVRAQERLAAATKAVKAAKARVDAVVSSAKARRELLAEQKQNAVAALERAQAARREFQALKVKKYSAMSGEEKTRFRSKAAETLSAHIQRFIERLEGWAGKGTAPGGVEELISELNSLVDSLAEDYSKENVLAARQRFNEIY